MENPKFGWAEKGIWEKVQILRHEGEQELTVAGAFPDNIAASQHKAIGENLVSTADRIETELNLLADTIDRILNPKPRP